MKKEVIPLTNEETNFYKEKKVCYICKKEFSNDDNDKKYHKVRDYCRCIEKFRGAPHNTLQFKI